MSEFPPKIVEASTWFDTYLAGRRQALERARSISETRRSAPVEDRDDTDETHVREVEYFGSIIKDIQSVEKIVKDLKEGRTSSALVYLRENVAAIQMYRLIFREKLDERTTAFLTELIRLRKLLEA